MKIKFMPDTIVTISSNKISFKKGLFNYTYSEVTSESDDFEVYKNIINEIQNNVDLKTTFTKKYNK